jgi:hypothetical protein
MAVSSPRLLTERCQLYVLWKKALYLMHAILHFLHAWPFQARRQGLNTTYCPWKWEGRSLAQGILEPNHLDVPTYFIFADSAKFDSPRLSNVPYLYVTFAFSGNHIYLHSVGDT